MDIKKIKNNCKKILNSKDLKILIWGCGKTGSSLVNFLKRNHKIFICDKNYKENFLEKFNLKIENFINEKDLKKALKKIDFIIPSPGIILPNFIKKSEKLITELDLFSIFWKGKIFAITGSVGKTSSTKILFEILKRKFKEKIEIGGNIGIPLFDLPENKVKFPVVLELSNLQLEHSKIFSPDYCIWLNTHKNHLDLHKNFASYVRAKSKMIINNPKKIKIFVTDKKTSNLLKKYKIEKPENTFIFSKKLKLEEDNIIPNFSFRENWKMLILLLKKSKLKIKLNKILKSINSKNFSLPEHRIEFCGKLKGNIDIFNDSKATIMESVFSAVNKLKNEEKKREITLIFGGKPKGVDRTKWLPILNNLIKNLIFFGEEKEIIKNFCNEKNIKISIKNSLEESIEEAIKKTEENEIILFSPGGSSFDLFKSYEDRGKRFKEIIKSKI